MKKQLRKALAILSAVAFAFTSITFGPANVSAADTWTHCQASASGTTTQPSGTPWTFVSTNNKSSTWGNMDYCITNPSDPSDVSSLKFRKNYSGIGGNGQPLVFSWFWDAAKLEGYGNDVLNMESDVKYTGTIHINASKATETTQSGEQCKFRIIPFGQTEIDTTLAVGDNEVEIPAFTYSAGSPDIVFNLIQLPNAGEITITSIEVQKVTDGYTDVPINEDYNPDDDTDNPWTLKVQRSQSDDTWGKMSYKIDETGSTLLDSTYLRADVVGHDDESTGVDQDDPTAWWWWNSGKLDKYADDSGMSEGKSYEGTVHFEYTAPDPATGYSPQIRMIVNGNVQTIALDEGDNELPIPEFEYGSALPTIEFNFDLLETGAVFRVTEVELTQVGGNWVRVPEVEEGVPYGVEIPVAYDSSMTHTGTVIHKWQLFNGYWGGEGCKLYYDNDLDDPRDPLSVKIGDGNRWDPACAQVKLTNTDAYQELENYTNYYMYYTFTSTEKGTVHINQEGYDPEGLEKVEITDDDYDQTDGLYHVTFKKIFTVLPESTGNLTMFLTGTTYGPGGVVLEDGDPLPTGTVLSDFKITYSRQDADYWTLVTDSRHEDHQNIDNIVVDSQQNPLLRAYANSYNKGRLSYKAGYYADGANDVAKMGLRLDQTAGSQIEDYSFDESWGANYQIPNAAFYNRNDTNGNPLVDGKSYKLRFYLYVDLPANTTMPTDTSGIIFVQQGYRADQWARYNIGSTTGTKITKDGFYMVNGSFTKKNGGDPYIAYEGDKAGGIDFVYDSQWNTGTRSYDNEPYSVMLDFSEFPEGTIISGVDWEFYAPGYNVYIDGTKNNENPITEDVGQNTYTFPSNQTQGFENVVKYVDDDDPTVEYTPGQTITFNDFNGADINVNTVRQHEVTIDGDHNAYVIDGENYTFPTNDTPGFENVKEFTDGTNTYQPGETIGPVEEDLAFESVPYASTKVFIREGSTAGPILVTGTVPEGQQYTLPIIQGIENYTYNGQTYNAGEKIGPFTQDVTVVANPTPTHTITIVNADDPSETLLTVTDFPHGDYYELPDLSPDYDVDYYEYDGEPWTIGESIGPINGNTVVEAVLVEYHTITIDGDFYASVRDGGSFTFPDGATAAKIGYIEVEGSDVFDPGTEVTDIYEDRDYLSIDEMQITPKPGACIYLNDRDKVNRRGIAFGAEFRLLSQSGEIINYQEYENVYKSDAFKLGTMITTEDLLYDFFDGDLDLSSVQKAQDAGHPEYIKNIANDYSFCDVEDPTQNFAEYRAGIINLNDYNITRNFIAKSYGYVETASGKTIDVVYADLTQPRSIKQVAINLKAVPSYYNNLPQWKKDIIDECAAYLD